MPYSKPSGKINPPKHNVRPKQIEGYYMLWNEGYNQCTVARCASELLAQEMANYCFGDNAVVYDVYTNTVSSILLGVARLRDLGIMQGYINDENVPVWYKTRQELIDEVLVEL